jgi:hypothetical protein
MTTTASRSSWPTCTRWWGATAAPPGLADAGHLDFAFEAAGTRVRANVFLHHDGLAAVLRLIRAGVPSLAELGLPAELAGAVEARDGLVLVCGQTGSGKSTTAIALLDPPGADPGRARRHPRGSDRAAPAQQARQRAPARDRHPHARLRDRPARRPARGARRDLRRRAARPGDHRHRADRGRHRAPGARHAALRRRGRRHRSHRRRLPRAPAAPGPAVSWPPCCAPC